MIVLPLSFLTVLGWKFLVKGLKRFLERNIIVTDLVSVYSCGLIQIFYIRKLVWVPFSKQEIFYQTIFLNCIYVIDRIHHRLFTRA